MIDLLRRRSSLIQTIVQYEHRVNGDLEQYKSVVELRNGSRLHINEVWLQRLLHKYAYYWLTPTGGLIQGWDNAPHHPQISTFPDHSHTPEGILPSSVCSLLDVLEELENKIEF